jgi:CrcB protein
LAEENPGGEPKWGEALRQYGAVAAGGVLGALLREVLEIGIPAVHGFPLATLLINWSGSFVLAWFYTITIWRWNVPQWLRTGAGTGIIGAYTTFSTFAVETDALLMKGQAGTAVLYVCLSLAGGLFLAIWGSRLGGEKQDPSVRIPSGLELAADRDGEDGEDEGREER